MRKARSGMRQPATKPAGAVPRWLATIHRLPDSRQLRSLIMNEVISLPEQSSLQSRQREAAYLRHRDAGIFLLEHTAPLHLQSVPGGSDILPESMRRSDN
ncbi:hypothetical protein GJ744_012115 [Endocarpon pusillum]|uniref:Uncharacterized protein n=1 Tax=Endocarpon pusillum TaxID=364733 RepID=A0A8H7ABR9_9EURO|nr:hypothetical protein GJ744_012115 [Endocarpon pusillum]